MLVRTIRLRYYQLAAGWGWRGRTVATCRVLPGHPLIIQEGPRRQPFPLGGQPLCADSDGGHIMHNSPQHMETLHFDDVVLANELFGPQNEHLTWLAERTGAVLSSRGATLAVEAPDDLREALLSLFAQSYSLLQQGHTVRTAELAHGLALLQADPTTDLGRSMSESAVVASPRKTIKARNVAQQRYIAALRSHEMAFGVGPAGTGKTYLAVAVALSMLLERRVRRLILTRPAVEAGERLGFLPGDMADKVNPYLRPLHDALHDMLGPQKMLSMQESGIIEVAPLAFMRGRTLNDAFILLDEAQNTTREQMKMLLTRLGFGSRAAITGDITQIDLPQQGDRDGQGRSGLVHALHVLDGVAGIAFCRFQAADVVRHPLVGRIVQAYQREEESAPGARSTIMMPRAHQSA